MLQYLLQRMGIDVGRRVHGHPVCLEGSVSPAKCDS
jgi:hypothetical protein